MAILLDYERACQQTTDKTQREQIALAALNFLLQNTAPDQQIEDEIALALEQEAGAAPGETTPLPEGDFQLNDVLGAHLEAQLADFFPSIFRLQAFSDQAAALTLLTRARMICQKVDTWRQHPYWTPLLDFLRNATSDPWRQWRSAVIAQQKARAAIGESKFNLAKRFAIYGLQRLAGIADQRLYLDLCSRLGNAIAEGDAYYGVAIALGYWVVKESLVAGHYLRAAGMRHNLGNQLLLTGKNTEAIAVLEQAQQLCNDYWYVRDMPYYQINGLERLACAYLNRGEEQRGTEALARYEFYSRQPREQALHRLEKGCLAMRAGTHETAEQRFEEARQLAHGGGNPPKDFYNVWNAYLSLGWVCTRRNKPAAALANLQQALTLGESLAGFLNADRWCHYYLVLAEARMANNELAAAQTALDSAEALLPDLDSPRRNMQRLLTKATLREAQGNSGEAQTCREQAVQIALANGFSTATIEQLKMAVFN